MTKSNNRLTALREVCRNDLFKFAQAICGPNRYFGDLHKELAAFLTNPEAKKCQGILLPRGHQKSYWAALWCVWYIGRNPDATILYISGSPTLAEKQMRQIQRFLKSSTYKKIFPEVLNWEENEFGKEVPAPKGVWTKKEVEVDHKIREDNFIREATVTALGYGSTLTGSHFDVMVVDDLVTEVNYISEVERDKVKRFYSTLASLGNTDSIIKLFGTPYHEDDLYAGLQDEVREVYNTKGEVISTTKTFEWLRVPVEDEGKFAWPRAKLPNKRYEGFDHNTLSKKKARYASAGHLRQFYAQYYLDIVPDELQTFTKEDFQYWDDSKLTQRRGNYYYSGAKLNIFAAMDLAYSEKKRADYTAIVVIGIDSDNNRFVLDIDRFKTEKPSAKFDRVMRLKSLYNFRKLRIDATGPQKGAAQGLKEEAGRLGISLVIDMVHYAGSKEERILNTLEPAYKNGTVFHYKGRDSLVLEDELMKFPNGKHDDVIDALAMAVDMGIAPSRSSSNVIDFNPGLKSHDKFGGVL